MSPKQIVKESIKIPFNDTDLQNQVTKLYDIAIEEYIKENNTKEVIQGYKPMSNRKNVLEEERNIYVKEIEEMELLIK